MNSNSYQWRVEILVYHCRKCGFALTEDNWYMSMRNNRNYVCIHCHREYNNHLYEQRSERARAVAKLRYWADPEKARARSRRDGKRYRQRHPERVKEQAKGQKEKRKMKLREIAGTWEGWAYKAVSKLSQKKSYIQRRGTWEWRCRQWVNNWYRIDKRQRQKPLRQSEYPNNWDSWLGEASNSLSRYNSRHRSTLHNDPWTKWADNKVSYWSKEENMKGKVTRQELLRLLKRQDYKCALTGEELSPETASPDHIVPLSRGGDHSIENIQITTLAVNIAKSTLTNREFVQVCRRVVAHNRSEGPKPIRRTGRPKQQQKHM